MRQMKDSNIPWIGEIPINWKTMSNKYLMKKVKDINAIYNGEDILSLSMKGVHVRDLEAGGKMPSTFDGYQNVYEGNLLMCLFDIDVTPRCIGLIKQDGITSPAYSQFHMEKIANSLYDEYIKFSKLSSKFDENACKKIWNEGRSGVGMCNMNTLKRYAMMDNEKEYLEVIKNKTNLYKNSLSRTPVDIAKYLIQKMLNYIVTGTRKNKVWYLFTNSLEILC